MNATARIPSILIDRADQSASIFAVSGKAQIAIKAGTIVTIGCNVHTFQEETPVLLLDPEDGCDYGVSFDSDGRPVASRIGRQDILDNFAFGGFYFAACGNATAREGGDPGAAINPFSCWDAGFRPACPDPRGMALVDGRFWVDIHLLNVDHIERGTSAAGVTIADGKDLPAKPGGGTYRKLDYASAVEIYAHHGKQLLGAEQFFTAAYGVKERVSRTADPKVTGDSSDIRFVSKWGLFDITGTLWQWGTDGDPDAPRASLFGGGWWDGGNAGSRSANLDCWPGNSDELISARGRSDHLNPAAGAKAPA